MKTILSIVLILIVQFGIAQTKSVLFIGNSFTMNYDMPKRLEKIARSQGVSLYTDQVTEGGKDWHYHATNPKTYQKIAAEPWDYVVLQGLSYEPLYPDSMLNRKTIPYGQQMIDSIRHHVPNAKIMLFMTWGYKNGMFLETEKKEIDYTEMQSRLHDQYIEFADSFEVAVAPVGYIWSKIRKEYPDVNLYYEDNYHQSQYGSFLIASTFYSMIFESTINNFSRIPYKVKEEAARNIATLASNTVHDPQKNWRKSFWMSREFEMMDYNIYKGKITIKANVPESYRVKWKINGKKVSKDSEIQVPLDKKIKEVLLIAREAILRRPRRETMIITEKNRVK
tara:strand:- start:196849 stop:197859 length:1011 start_codon:yes stop_codon:yes gene_type:complete